MTPNRVLLDAPIAKTVPTLIALTVFDAFLVYMFIVDSDSFPRVGDGIYTRIFGVAFWPVVLVILSYATFLFYRFFWYRNRFLEVRSEQLLHIGNKICAYEDAEFSFSEDKKYIFVKYDNNVRRIWIGFCKDIDKLKERL